MLFPEPGRSNAGRSWRRSRWMHTPGGRVFVGVLLAQGLFYALRHLFTGVMLLIEGDNGSAQAWTTFHGLLFLQALQVLAPALGGVLAGAGHRSGSLLGAFVGSVNGAFSLLLLQAPAQSNSAVAMYGLPLLQTLFGALGGWVGCTIWKPIQPVSYLRAEKKAGLARPRVPVFSGPVSWVRVVLGSALAVAGSVFANRIFDTVMTAGGGHLDFTQLLQDEIVTWEIKAFAVLFGAGLAGSSSFNGLKQGLCVGVITGMAMLAVPSHHSTTLILALTLASALLLSLAGGWFGSQLLPPILKISRSGHRYGPADA
jgi:hypothetical protein